MKRTTVPIEKIGKRSTDIHAGYSPRRINTTSAFTLACHVLHVLIRVPECRCLVALYINAYGAVSAAGSTYPPPSKVNVAPVTKSLASLAR